MTNTGASEVTTPSERGIAMTRGITDSCDELVSLLVGEVK